MGLIGAQISAFTTLLLGIFIEAVPFLLLGALSSGFIKVFISREQVAEILPRNLLLVTFAGCLLGFVFPVGEIGAIPLTRRLLGKGVPVSSGTAFLVAAPLLNPVVLASTFAAYGWGAILFARVGFGLLIAFAIGLVFSLSPSDMPLLNSSGFSDDGDSSESLSAAASFRVKSQKALMLAGDEFLEIGRYLVVGSLLGALAQTLVPSQLLVAAASGPLLSVVALQLLAFVLSTASTSDAFIALRFLRIAATGSILSFLIFGPIIDLKSAWIVLRVFHWRVAIYLTLLAFLLTLLMGVFINLNTPW